MERPIIAVTMGDPAGIGAEVAVKALYSPEVLRYSRSLIIGDISVLKKAVKISKLTGVKTRKIKSIKEARFLRGVIDVIDLDNVKLSRLKTGKISAYAGRASMQYLDRAMELALDGKIQAIATGPINKEAIHKAGYKFQGHTEILAQKTKSKNYAMMFVSESLWVILVTTHLPLSEVPRTITKEKIFNTIRLAHLTMTRLRERPPRIAVAGLNPHASEGGIFGAEEKDKIIPAVEQAKKLKIKVDGPISPDAVFYLAKIGMYDIVVSMYHDQGLIPLKLLSFNNSVNVTVGLPIIRTSVDHGTGFDIAGRGWANPSSLIQAIKVAAHFAKS